MQGKTSQMTGRCPLAPASAFHLSVCLPCYFIREKKMPAFPGLGASQHNRISKTESLAAKAKVPGAWAVAEPPLPSWKNLACALRHIFEWLRSFRLLSSFEHVHQRVREEYIREFVRSLQPTARVARGGTQQSSGRANG